MGIPDFSLTAIFYMELQLILMICIIVIIWRAWRRRTNEKFSPCILGAATWLIFAVVLEGFVRKPLLEKDTFINSITAATVLCSVLAGIFEESGRFIAFKILRKNNRNRRTSVTYGIGHGCFEAFFMIVPSLIICLIFGIAISTGFFEPLTSSMSETYKATLISQLTEASKINGLSVFQSLLERCSAIAFHISMSVLVFAAANDKKYLKLYPLTLLLHFGFNAMSLLYVKEVVSLTVFELIMAATAAVISFFVYHFYCSLPQEVGNHEGRLECNGGPDKALDTDNASKE